MKNLSFLVFDPKLEYKTGKFKDIRAAQGNNTTTRRQYLTTSFTKLHLDRLQESWEMPHIGRPSRAGGVGTPSRRGIGQGTSWGEGNWKRGFCVQVILLSSKLGISEQSELQRVAGHKVCLTYGQFILSVVLWVKQRWLKLCFVGLYLRQLVV